ncbi:hypothetical protein SLEP1_g32493 [Rubroshorea leprosula]|uniref:Uncharacterized protein n=1 Tax=Rubroshorea leprosula TaxID=152421 RepID=A0AAV5KDI0_9ROSI|nr:hypothetical protein SLEP1_g32493 [Rubroshorea leprosula]
MESGEIETFLNRVHLIEDEDGFLPLLSIWKLDDSWSEKLQLVGKFFFPRKGFIRGRLVLRIH